MNASSRFYKSVRRKLKLSGEMRVIPINQDAQGDALKELFNEVQLEQANLNADASEQNARAYIAAYNALAESIGEERFTPDEIADYKRALRIISP